MRPIDRFNEWVRAEQYGKMKQLADLYGEDLLRHEMPNIRAWLIDPAKQSKAKRRTAWYTFLRNWLKKEHGKTVIDPANMSYAQEIALERQKTFGRQRTSEMERLDD